MAAILIKSSAHVNFIFKALLNNPQGHSFKLECCWSKLPCKEQPQQHRWRKPCRAGGVVPQSPAGEFLPESAGIRRTALFVILLYYPFLPSPPLLLGPRHLPRCVGRMWRRRRGPLCYAFYVAWGLFAPPTLIMDTGPGELNEQYAKSETSICSCWFTIYGFCVLWV